MAHAHLGYGGYITGELHATPLFAMKELNVVPCHCELYSSPIYIYL